MNKTVKPGFAGKWFGAKGGSGATSVTCNSSTMHWMKKGRTFGKPRGGLTGDDTRYEETRDEWVGVALTRGR